MMPELNLFYKVFWNGYTIFKSIKSMPAKILIADDEPEIRTLLKSRLECFEYSVLLAANGEDALQKVFLEKPDLLILDILMPKLTGYEVLEKLKANTLTNHIPVIVISARHSMKDFIDNSKTVAFLPKPFDPQVLHDTILEVLKDRKSPSPVENPPVLDGIKKQKKALVAGKTEFIAKKIKEFLEQYHFSVSMELEDHFALETAKSSSFDLIICQLWEDPKIFNAPAVYAQVKALPHLNSAVFVVYCISALAIDAKQQFEHIPIIPFDESEDLKKKLYEVLTRKALI